MLSASIHDGVQTSQTSKFVYRLWRPETAINQAAVDGNDATSPETPWLPLLTTPPYPSHASNMACIGFSAARALANVLGRDAQSFTATWYTAETPTSPPTVVHAEPYRALSDLASDEGNSRIWGGIHFRFEIDASEVSCYAGVRLHLRQLPAADAQLEASTVDEGSSAEAHCFCGRCSRAVTVPGRAFVHLESWRGRDRYGVLRKCTNARPGTEMLEEARSPDDSASNDVISARHDMGLTLCAYRLVSTQGRTLLTWRDWPARAKPLVPLRSEEAHLGLPDLSRRTLDLRTSS